jgi:L-cystine transport system permease protein
MAATIFVFSTLIGGLFAFIEHKRIPVLRELVLAYKVFFKGVPMVIAIFLAYFGLPKAVEFLGSLVGADITGQAIPNWVILIVALTGCLAAFQSEVIKGALNSFDKGQADAARSFGYKDFQMFRRILFPQVVVAAIPDLAIWSS